MITALLFANFNGGMPRILFGVAGGVLLALVLLIIAVRVRFWLNSELTEGEVIGVEARKSAGEDGTSNYLKIRYCDRDGVPHEFVDNVGTGGNRRHMIGKKAPVRYLPHQTEQKPQHWALLNVAFLPALLLLIGGVALAIVFSVQ